MARGVRQLYNRSPLTVSRESYKRVTRKSYSVSEKSHVWFCYLGLMESEGIVCSVSGLGSYSGYDPKSCSYCFGQLSRFGLVSSRGVNGSTVYSLTLKGRELFGRILEFERDYLAGL